MVVGSRLLYTKRISVDKPWFTGELYFSLADFYLLLRKDSPRITKHYSTSFSNLNQHWAFSDKNISLCFSSYFAHGGNACCMD